MLKRFNDLLDFISANKVKEYVLIAVINIAILASAIILTIFLKQIMIAFVGLIALVISNYLIVNSYIEKKT